MDVWNGLKNKPPFTIWVNYMSKNEQLIVFYFSLCYFCAFVKQQVNTAHEITTSEVNFAVTNDYNIG